MSQRSSRPSSKGSERNVRRAKEQADREKNYFLQNTRKHFWRVLNYLTQAALTAVLYGVLLQIEAILFPIIDHNIKEFYDEAGIVQIWWEFAKAGAGILTGVAWMAHTAFTLWTTFREELATS